MKMEKSQNANETNALCFAIEQNSVSVSEYERKVLRPGRSTCISFSCTKYFRKLYADNFFSKLSHAKDSSPVSLKSSKLKWENLLPLMGVSGSFSDLIKVGDTDRVFDFFTNIEPTLVGGKDFSSPINSEG